MYVLSQDRKCLVNLDNVIDLKVVNNCIIAEFDNSKITTLAIYKDEERAVRVLEKIYLVNGTFEYFKYVDDENKEQISEFFCKEEIDLGTYVLPKE